PGVQTVSIVLDPKPATREIADQISRIAASEAWDCIREGGRVEIGSLVSRDIWEVLEWLARYPDDEMPDETRAADMIIVTADPSVLDSRARRNWLVGGAEGVPDVDHERVGLAWPL
ncbi:MAG TPA: hypothetical protein VFR33_05520, partial [Candidatus Dormibacteraeota bacterium]|nr:hypothetical protein [Candidatus Dormibacteraeota bacterium]